MARVQGLLLFFALLVAVYGAATPGQHYKPKFCKNHRGAIKEVRNSFAYPREFCKWYNSAKRRFSPLTDLPATQIINACECINEKAPSKKPTDFVAPEYFEPVCDSSLQRKLAGITYKQPKQFCQFWGNGAGTHFRRVGPFHKQGLTNQDTYNACACYDLFSGSSPAATTTSVDEPVATTTSVDESATTTSVDEPMTTTTDDILPGITTIPVDNPLTTLVTELPTLTDLPIVTELTTLLTVPTDVPTTLVTATTTLGGFAIQ